MTGPSPTIDPWPADLRPEGAPVVSFNALDIPFPVDRVWAVLIRAGDWPALYANCKDLRFIDGPGPDLSAGQWFTWRTFGLRVRTRVTDFEPGHLLGWRGDTWYGRGYHLWRLEPTQAGCRLVTEEAQRGLVPTLLAPLLRRGLHHWHQRWLEGLAARVAGVG